MQNNINPNNPFYFPPESLPVELAELLQKNPGINALFLYLQRQINDLQTQNGTQATQIKDLKSQNGMQATQIAVLKSQNGMQTTQISNQQSEIDDLKAQKDDLTRRIGIINERSFEAFQQHETASQHQATRNQIIIDQTNEINNLRQKNINELQKTFDSQIENIKSLTSATEALTQTYNSVNNQVQRLRTEMPTIQNQIQINEGEIEMYEMGIFQALAKFILFFAASIINWSALNYWNLANQDIESNHPPTTTQCLNHSALSKSEIVSSSALAISAGIEAFVAVKKRRKKVVQNQKLHALLLSHNPHTD